MDEPNTANDSALQSSSSGSNDNTTTTTSASSKPNTAAVISDDEVQILSVTKREGIAKPSIKIESSDEEETLESKDFLINMMSECEKPKDLTDSIKSACENEGDAAGSSSPKDPTCSICLGEFDNKSFLDQCFHSFCFYCILQWSEIVRTCPLCKAEFSQIIHSVKSMTEYQQHKLPPKENSTTNTSNDRRRFRYRTTLIDGRLVSRNNTARRPNAWEERADKRERMLALRRRKSIQAKEKRHSIYARNLWVQTVTQIGRTKYRDTSPQFFRTNPACTHRLVPWLTRELQCLLNDEHSHVEFVLQLILTLITKIAIDSEEFIEQLRPFLSDKTEHFCHEFLSYARSPFDVTAYDERAQYDWPRQTTQQVEQTPMVVDITATGWDSPDEAQTPRSAPYSSEPGPSGISTEALNGWSLPIAQSIELPPTDVWSDVIAQPANEQIRTDVIELSPEVIDVGIPKQKHRHKHKHKHKHRHKHQHKTRNYNTEHFEPGPSFRGISTSSSGSNSRVDVVILSSGLDSSPEARLQSRGSSSERSHDDNSLKSRHKGKHSKRKYTRGFDSSDEKLLRSCDSISDRSLDDSHRKSPRKGKHFKRNYTRSREKSIEIRYKHRRESSEKSISRNRSRTLSPVACDPAPPAVLNGSSESAAVPLLATVAGPSEARALSPTEEEMKQEILELERKIAEDTKRLEELLKKQERRKIVAALAAGASSLNTEDSETDEQSR